MAELLVFGENLKGINHLVCIVGNHWVVYAECIGNCVECLPTATYRTWTAHIGKRFTTYLVPGHEAAVWAGMPRFPSPQTLHPALQRGFQCASRPLEWPGGFQLAWILPSFSSQWDVPETLPKVYRCPHLLGASIQMLRPFDLEEWQLYSELPTLSLRRGHSAEETLLFHLHPAPCSFSHIAKFQALGEGRDVDWPVDKNLNLKFVSSTNGQL